MTHEFSARELADPLRGTKRLVFAAQDMKDAREATDAILAEGEPRRAMETAAVVSYARPWTNATIGRLEDHWLPKQSDARDLHDALLRLRRKVYAHNDNQFGARGIRDVSSVTGSPTPVFAPEYRQIKEELLPVIRQLADAQYERFRTAAEALSSSVTRFVVRVVWPSTDSIASPERVVLLDELESEVFALVPHGEHHSGDRAVILELHVPPPDATGELEALTYAIKRLIRAVRQWWRRLRLEGPSVMLTIEGNVYVLTHDAPQKALNPAAIASDHLAAHASGERRWQALEERWS